MIVTYSWLKEYVACDLTPDELGHRLTMAGLEVDALTKSGDGLDSVIVARLLSVEPHPEADRLTLCQVDTGSETLQVVCGARNHKAGDLIALAQVGSVLPGDFKIKKSKIRNLESCGMLCSEKELGLAEASEGIIILPPGLPLGTPVFEALNLKDSRFELGLTPNRPDCLSVVGVAREVAAMVGQPLTLPRPQVQESGELAVRQTSVTIDESLHCPRYAARLIRGVKIGPSPEWMVRRLESVGQRSINNVVDVTNYVLMELGHPLHAFDFQRLRGGRIVVRCAAEGEKFTTLDSQVRTLAATDLTICDGVGPVALAGIMGGENSEICPETTDILLESAYFNPVTIRRTSKRLGIHSESSHRFERGADVDMVPLALDRAAALIVEVAGGTIAPGVIDVYPQPLATRKIELSAERCAGILGLQLDGAEIGRLLASIGLRVEPMGGLLAVTIPNFRPDLEREIDLIEEVARLAGYDQIPTTLPVSRILCHRPPLAQQQQKALRNALVAAGFAETISYAFIAPDAWSRIGLAPDDVRRTTVAVLNPLTEEQSVMRTSLVPSMLETVARNLSHRSRDLRLFELRPVFLPQPGEELPNEPLRLVAAICGRRDPEGWAHGNEAVDFFDLKGMVEGLLKTLQIEGVAWLADGAEPYLHPGKSARLQLRGRNIGSLGEVHPRVLANYGIETPVFLLDLGVEAFFAGSRNRAAFRAPSRFPVVERDTALLLDESVSAQQLFDLFARVRSQDAEEMLLFDVYRGKGVAEGKKSLALRVRYRSAEKTLTDEEVNQLHGTLVEAFCKKLNAVIR